jgi:hypothetical protein
MISIRYLFVRYAAILCRVQTRAFCCTRAIDFPAPTPPPTRHIHGSSRSKKRYGEALLLVTLPRNPLPSLLRIRPPKQHRLFQAPIDSEARNTTSVSDLLYRINVGRRTLATRNLWHRMQHHYALLNGAGVVLPRNGCSSSSFATRDVPCGFAAHVG